MSDSPASSGSDSPVRYALTGKTAVLTMDDGKANALSEPMLRALLAALDRAEQEASAVVLTGRPDRFCAGFDLRVMMSGPQHAMALLKLGSELLLRLFGLPLPLVIASTGHALAGGALVVLTGDTRLGAAGAYKIGLNEVAIGLHVPVLAMELARARLSPAELTRATLQAQIYDPAGAAAAGYLDRVVSADALAEAALAEANRLGQLARAAYAATKQRLRSSVIEHIRTTFDVDIARATGSA
jgi:enoyl-CoA hydratase